MQNCMLNVKVVHTAGSVTHHYVLFDKTRAEVEMHLFCSAENFVGLIGQCEGGVDQDSSGASDVDLKSGQVLKCMLIVMQLGVMTIWPCSTAEGFRRRAQALAWIENLSLLYRSLLPMPVWYKYFEDSGMGMVLCALTTGMHIASHLLLSFGIVETEASRGPS